MKQVESVAWDFALEFQKSCKPQESSSEFVYRLRDMATKMLWDYIDSMKNSPRVEAMEEFVRAYENWQGEESDKNQITMFKAYLKIRAAH